MQADDDILGKDLLMGSEAIKAGFIGKNVPLKQPPYTLSYSNKRIQRRNRFLSYKLKK